MDGDEASVDGDTYEVREVLDKELCEELILIQRICGVPGYRPHYISTLCHCAPPWALPALARARQVILNAAEDIFSLHLDLFFETTALACWLPGSEIPAHTDNGQAYLASRDVSASVWLNSEFEGGEFFFSDASEKENQAVVTPMMGTGRGAIYRAGALHGVLPVRSGERFSMLAWMTRKEEESEDAKLLPSLDSVHLLSSSERLFGFGPQETWPEDAHVSRDSAVASFGLTIAELEEKYAGEVSQLEVWLPLDRWRLSLALAAYAMFLMKKPSPGDPQLSQEDPPAGLARQFMAYISSREAVYEMDRKQWLASGLLASGCEEAGKARLCDHPGLYVGDGVPGLVLLRSFICPEEQRTLLAAAKGMVGECNQAMRFGDVPSWAAELASRIGVKANQLIVNEYAQGGDGICRHVDLLRFADCICGVSLGAAATMTFRQLAKHVRLVGGMECSWQDSDFSGREVSVVLMPGDIYILNAEARYRWTHEILGASVQGQRLSITLRTVLV